MAFTMNPASRISIAGHRRLFGSAIHRNLLAKGYTNFAQERPEYVFLAAAKVGGIHANNTYPADVKKLLFLNDNYHMGAVEPQWT